MAIALRVIPILTTIHPSLSKLQRAEHISHSACWTDKVNKHRFLPRRGYSISSICPLPLRSPDVSNMCLGPLSQDAQGALIILSLCHSLWSEPPPPGFRCPLPWFFRAIRRRSVGFRKLTRASSLALIEMGWLSQVRLHFVLDCSLSFPEIFLEGLEFYPQLMMYCTSHDHGFDIFFREKFIILNYGIPFSSCAQWIYARLFSFIII